MGLQIRVKHALGERVIELPDRTVEEPIVIGRGSSADVQVPSVTVAPKHCALFIHEGRWVVQDLGAGGTSVNGQPVTEPALLQIGDAITVGTDALAPTIEVDPAAAAEGRTGFAGGTGGSSSATAAPVGGYGVPGYPGGFTGSGYGSGSFGAPAAVRPPSYMAPAPVAVMDPAPAAAEAPAAATEASALSAAAASAPSYRRRRDNTFSTQLAVIAICGVMIAGLVALVVWRMKEASDASKQQAQQPVVIIRESQPKPATRYIVAPSPTPKPPPTVTPVRPKNGGGGTNTKPPKTPDNNTNTQGTPKPTTPDDAGMDPRPSPSPKPAGPDEGMDPIRRPTTKPAGGGDEGMDPIRRPTTQMADGGGDGMMDTRRPTSAPAAPPPRDAENISATEATKWEVMKELAGMTGKESFAVWRFEEFKKTNPSKAAELDQMIEKKLDVIWWERIEGLFTRIEKLDDLRKDIKLNKLPDVNDPAQKKVLIDAFTKADTDMKAAKKTLTDIMGYKDSKPPAKEDAALDSARQARSQSLYNNWKLITVKAIVQNQGKLPWAGEM